MKYSLLILISLLFLGTNLSAQGNEDLLNILKKETEAFANADFETWKSLWCQTENDYFSYAEQNNVFVVKGWSAIDQTFKAAFQGRKKYDVSFRRENVKVERDGKLAFIVFDQYDKLNDANGEVHKTETRIMKKTKAGWKILSTEVVNLSSYEKSGKALYHILLASFKPEAKDSDVQYIFDKFNSVRADVEGMKSCTMLKNGDPASPFQYTFIMTFSSAEALAQYEAHAAHKAAVDRWIAVGDKVTVVDSWK
ncbi:MAG: Dabb family protein [Thermoanaerobaculia bacterium]|nr:Dabb family protein [Thermoanaerobaculia bacterium]